MKKRVSVTYWAARPQKSKWVVKVSQNGHRNPYFFVTEQEARVFAREKEIELLQEGTRRAGITSEDRRAIEIASEHGFTVLDAVTHYTEHLGARHRSVLVSTAIEELLEIREAEGRSNLHLADLRHRLRAFGREHGERLMAEIRTRDIDGWITGLTCAAQTKKNFRRAVHNLFTFATTRGYCPANPVTAAVKVKVPPAIIGILDVPQARALLTICSPDILPAITVGLFAGLRASEIERLDWRDIDLERGFIEVGAAKTKTAKRRLVQISENLSAWLAPHRQDSGPVRPSLSTYRRKLAVALRASGITKWPDNALRHSFASYHLAMHQDAAKTALQLGHHESRTLFAHYRELVRAEDARAYWQIEPSDSIVAFQRTA
jgi:integrase